MPVAIKSSRMEYKDDNGNYIGVDAVSERTTAEQVAEIEAAGDAKVQLIQDKADAVTAQLANAAEVRNMLAGVFDPAVSYVAGQYVIQTISDVNKLFRFIADHPAGNWIGTDAVEVKLANDVTDLKSAITYKMDTLHEIFNEYGMDNRYDIGTISNAKISEAVGKGVTITQLSSTSFMLNGTATAGFNINLFRTRNVGGIDYFSVKCSDQTVDASDIGMTLGYFNQEDTAVGYLAAVGINQAPKKVEYPSAAVKNRDYFAIQKGGSFTNAVFYVCASPTQTTTFDEKILQNTQLINDEKTSFTYSFAPLVLGYKSYIEYDTVAETITIPRDVVYLGNKINGSAIYKGLNTDAPYVISNVNYSTFSSTSLKLVIDTDAWDFKLIRYSTGNVSKYKLVAAVRLKSSTYQGGLCTPFPWKMDGKPYGIDLGPYDTVATLFDYNGIVETAAHRGWYTDPENTLIAYKTARKMGCLGGETDIAFTAPDTNNPLGVPVLLHDATINRTARNADGTSISSTVYIRDITYAEALEYDFGIYKGSQFTGTKIPKLEEFAKLCRSIGMTPYIELKQEMNYTDAEIELIVNTVNKCGLQDVAVYISFSATYLGKVKALVPTATLGLVVQQALTSTHIQTAQALQGEENKVFISSNALSEAECALCANAGIPLWGWDIESKTGIRDANPYITGFTMNHFVAGKVLYDYGIQ